MKYEQVTGRLSEDDGKVIGFGWAGHLQGKNNPDMENIKGVGPLPKGKYTVGDPEDGTHLGPLAFPLTPGSRKRDVWTQWVLHSRSRPRASRTL